ncbi:MAG TPA: hypothetical protein VF677_04930 [Flavobacterium sp.]|jgi:hypothetical protein
MKRYIIIIIIAFVAGYTTIEAQVPAVMLDNKAGWHKIGETTVNYKKEKDQVLVLGYDRFSAIKFKVEDAPIDLSLVEVYYKSGDKQSINVGSSLKANEESKEIKLNGGKRKVKKIVFVYKTQPNNDDKRAHVAIWGLKQ